MTFNLMQPLVIYLVSWLGIFVVHAQATDMLKLIKAVDQSVFDLFHFCMRTANGVSIHFDFMRYALR